MLGCLLRLIVLKSWRPKIVNSLYREKAVNEDNLEVDDALTKLVEQITPSVYESLKTAVELGKWGNGDKLSEEQLENSLQMVILYEAKNLKASERIEATLPKGCSDKILQ